MSRLIDNGISIAEAMRNIEDGKYVIPAFQRQYVWTMPQVEKLWDSILLGYPISTFLFWHLDDENTTWDMYFCNFLKDITFNSSRASDSPNYDLSAIDVSRTSTAILDGQQRLTSLYLSMCGQATIREKYARKNNSKGIISELTIELNKNKVDIAEDEHNCKKFDIRFTEKTSRTSDTQFKVRMLLDERLQRKEIRKSFIEKIISYVPEDSRDYARDILETLCVKIHDEKLIRYTEIYDMNQSDALEMFIRFNSGGKKLKKSEITMSILEVYWPSARNEFNKILTGVYDNFDSEFIIRASLMLYGNVDKFIINKNIANDLKNNWNDFKKALKNLADIMAELRIDLTRYSRNWNILLPVLYFIYHNSEYREYKEAIRIYIMRGILFIYFRSGTPGKLQQMKNAINEANYEFTVNMLDRIPTLTVSDGKIEDILNTEKGSTVAEEALYYLSLDWNNKNVRYEEDHLHPISRFDSTKPVTVSMDEWRQWKSLANRLPNLQYLEGRTNSSKSDMRLIDYYNDMTEEQQQRFRKQSMIPAEISLEIEDFGVFYAKRKEIMANELKKLLVGDKSYFC